jgi:Chemotaxis phosphatase CheX
MVEAPAAARLAELATDLLSEAAFIFAEPTGEFVGESSSLLVGRVRLECDGAWELIVAVEAKLGRSLAANLLGVDESSEETDTAIVDSVGEWSNIMAGALGVEFKGALAPCRIGVPVVAIEPGASVTQHLANAPCKAHLISEEGGRIALCLARRT